MTSWECYENKWFYMKYIGKYLSAEILLTREDWQIIHGRLNSMSKGFIYTDFVSFCCNMKQWNITTRQCRLNAWARWVITRWPHEHRHQGRIHGGCAPGAPPPPLKLEKIWIFGVKSWFFTRNTPTIFALPSARRNFFNCASPNLKSWIRPWTPMLIYDMLCTHVI